MHDKEYVKSLENGLSVLQCFTPQHKRLNISKVAQITGMTRAAARRYLFTLEQLGYIEKKERCYLLTSKVLGFTGAYFSTAHLPIISQPVINQLTYKFNLAFSISLLEGFEVTTICRSSNYNYVMHQYPYGMHLGNRLPSHTTSAGKLLLAYQDPQRIHRIFKEKILIKLTPYTKTNKDELLLELDEIRLQEWCYSAQEHELGIHAVAVPVFDLHDNVIAALNVVSPLNETSKAYLIQEILPHLLSAAYDIRKLTC